MEQRMHMPCARGYKKKIWNFKKGFSIIIGCVTATLLCVVFLHCQLTTSGGLDDGGQKVPPSKSRHIRSFWPEGLSESLSDVPTPPWLRHFCFGQPVSPSSAGDAPTGFVLEQIYILLNPGITSSGNVQNCVQVPASSYQLANHTEQLLKYTTLHKNFQNIPEANSSVHCRKEELHPLAHLQLHKLGMWFKKQYIEKWDLESSHVAQKHFRLNSVDEQDNLSSLMSFLHGLLPHNSYQKIIIHKIDATATVKKQTLNNSDADCNFLSNLTKHHHKHFTQLSPDFHEMGNFTNVILPELCTSLSQKYRNLTQENMVQNALLLIDKGMKECSSLKKYQDLADLHAYSWLQEFVNNVKTRSRVFEKVFIYVVDRAFLSYLMSAFRYRNVKATHPGSHITIEIYRNLYERVNPDYIKILYNDVDITHQIPLCTKYHPWSLCKLKYFVDFQKQKYKNLFKSKPKIQKKCHFSLF